MTELLAPVGAFESLVASIMAGADAVYLSGSKYGARKFAENFTEEKLKEAVEYAHIRGVSVYVTVNTLIKTDEIEDVRRYIDFLYSIDVDAIIVQDLSVADYIRTNYPDMELHASTQMNVHSLRDIEFLENFGFSRVVLAREVSLEEIKYIKSHSNMELEVFIHGSLCVSYSGQCLMSSEIGDRSGNRGSCAQPCRQKYTVNDETSFLISPKDLNLFDDIHKLIEVGVDSLKIEGRMKGADYAALVVKSYREKIDKNKNTGVLNKVFNRSYTKGYLLSDKKYIGSDIPSNRGELIGYVKAYDKKRKMLSLTLLKELKKGDEIQIRRDGFTFGARTDVFYSKNKRVKTYDYKKGIEVEFKQYAIEGEKVFRTYDNEVMSSAKQIYHKEMLSIPIDMEIHTEDRGLYLSITDKEHMVKGSIEELELAKNPASLDKIVEKLSKLGGTPYQLDDIKADIDLRYHIPLSALNELKSTLINDLSDQRKNRYHRKEKKIEKKIREYKKEPEHIISVTARKKEQLDAIRDLDVFIYEYKMPRILEDRDYKEIKEKKLVNTYGYLDENSYADVHLNIYNQETINTYSDLNINRICLSYELSYEELKKLKPNKNQDLECIVYGYTPVMIMKYCPVIKSITNCKSCDRKCEKTVFEDRFHNKYHMISLNNRLEILNYNRLFLYDEMDQILEMDIKYLRLDFTIENPEEVRAITKLFIDRLHHKKTNVKFNDITTGHFYRPIL